MIEEKLKVGILVRNTREGWPQGRIVQEISDYINGKELDVFLGPEWLFMPCKSLYSKEGMIDRTGRLLEISKGKPTLIIPGTMMWQDGEYFYNTAPIISNGSLIGSYNKRRDGGSTEKAAERNCMLKQYPAIDEGIFQWKGYSIGVEICADHGLLGSYLRKAKKPFMDLYFLVACGYRLYDADSPVREMSYSMCSDGHKPWAEVRFRIRKTHEEISPGQGKGIVIPRPGKDLAFYELIMGGSHE